MQQLNAKPFLEVATELRSLQHLINQYEHKVQLIGNADTAIIQDHLVRLLDAIGTIGANLAEKSVNRLRDALETNTINYDQLSYFLREIEGRFVDHIEDVHLFIVADGDKKFLLEASDLYDWEVGFNFPTAMFEIEEAAKCLALGRYTASAFHSIRILEIGIRGVAKHLEIDLFANGNTKNWGTILSEIKRGNDAKYPKSNIATIGQRTFFESVHASLDAVRNPWRNATMHVETIYAAHEAEHIFNCVKFFMEKLATRIDEDGHPLVT
ncbi:hypothetical protein [Novosphingobium sp. B1]|uniref:hypothetical protein n=1 Tax=Novosphingobium sp. B1 TaxID=1938756 RepID=UPI0009D8DD6C|nr:hypothetical protein [Novosphingobium sp. B1]SMC76021.1 hypothetical protein SAMN06272759_106325 [Novosphingobium sp. B1]